MSHDGFPQPEIDAMLAQVREGYRLPDTPRPCTGCGTAIASPQDAYFDATLKEFFDCWFCTKDCCDAWLASTD